MMGSYKRSLSTAKRRAVAALWQGGTGVLPRQEGHGSHHQDPACSPATLALITAMRCITSQRRRSVSAAGLLALARNNAYDLRRNGKQCTSNRCTAVRSQSHSTATRPPAMAFPATHTFSAPGRPAPCDTRETHERRIAFDCDGYSRFSIVRGAPRGSRPP